MSKKMKAAGKKKTSPRGMRDKYWKQVLFYAEQRQWQELLLYIDNHPWLATSYMGPTILPDYLAEEKEYGLLRLLCNVEDVPVEVVRKIIVQGAKDRAGRAYLERLLVGSGANATEEERKLTAAADSPLVAAEVLKTCDHPMEVIDRIQRVLEQGLDDNDAARKALAERCIERSQLFYDLLMALHEHDATNLLGRCLGREKILVLAAEGKLHDFATIENILAEQ